MFSQSSAGRKNNEAGLQNCLTLPCYKYSWAEISHSSDFSTAKCQIVRTDMLVKKGLLFQQIFVPENILGKKHHILNMSKYLLASLLIGRFQLSSSKLHILKFKLLQAI